jgi:predicted MPP superfamily phosphohydrolase
MSKIFSISNTLFGYKNYVGFNRFLEESEKFFNDELIPFLQKYAKKDDYFIHLGNLFVSKQQLNVKAINSVQTIFEKISNILPVYFLIGEHDRYTSNNDINTLTIFKNYKNIFIVNDTMSINDNILLFSYDKNIINILNKHENIDYIFTSNNMSNIDKNYLLKYKKIYSGYSKDNYVENNIVSVGTPYQIEPNTKNKGFFVLDINSNNDKFILNKTNFKFVTLHINNIEELKNFDETYFQNNVVDMVVNKDLMDNMEFKIKISNYNIQSLICEEDVKEPEDDRISDFFDVDELILSKINDNSELLKEFNNILNINKQ